MSVRSGHPKIIAIATVNKKENDPNIKERSPIHLRRRKAMSVCIFMIYVFSLRQPSSHRVCQLLALAINYLNMGFRTNFL